MGKLKEKRQYVFTVEGDTENGILIGYRIQSIIQIQHYIRW